MTLEENIKALRPAIAEDCAAEMAKTHGMDPAELAKQLPGGRINQQKSEHARCVEARDSIQVKRVKQLLYALNSFPPKPLSPRLQKQLIGSDELRPLAAAMTILLTDYAGTIPSATCEMIADAAPSVYRAYGLRRVLAVCEEIQQSEIPAQSRLYQRMFQRFNIRYFAGRLPDYKVVVVYDVWFWETERWGCPECFPPACEAVGFIDFAGRRMLIRFLGHYSGGETMAQFLTHEMAHVATDGEHGANWQAEMARLRGLGAPVSDWDL